jgi:CheY-like chemotaxis protein
MGAMPQRSAASLRVLLADDSAVNRKLVVRLLEKWGHSVVVAENGRRAVELWTPDRFDLVLMDVQMTEVDGFTATAAIRQRERVTDGHIPIIALTAHALKGDRERCLQAGMDGYVAKPIHAQELFRAIEELHPVSLELAIAISTPSQQTAFDKQAALDRLAGDGELLKELVGVFLECYPRHLETLRGAIADQDRPTMLRTAHTFKSELAHCGARGASATAWQLESAPPESDWQQLEQMRAALEDAIRQVLPSLESLRDEPS